MPRLTGAPIIAPLLDRKWFMKVVPWFEDENRKITALTFDEDGFLYVGTRDGHIYEMNVMKVLEDGPGQQNELKLVFSLKELRVCPFSTNEMIKLNNYYCVS